MNKIPSIIVICGSESDLPAVLPVLEGFSAEDVRIRAHVISCHRNPYELLEFVELITKDCSGTIDAIICVGGKAFALPGVLDAFLYAASKKAGKDSVPVIGVALGEQGTRSLQAAILSIEEIPGYPVILKYDYGCGVVYLGPEGLGEAIKLVIDHKLPPLKTRTEKSIKPNVWTNCN